jgi:hypothetical protein
VSFELPKHPVRSVSWCRQNRDLHAAIISLQRASTPIRARVRQ